MRKLIQKVIDRVIAHVLRPHVARLLETLVGDIDPEKIDCEECPHRAFCDELETQGSRRGVFAAPPPSDELN